MVYAPQQDGSHAMWQVRHVVAQVHRLHLCSWRSTRSRRRMDVLSSTEQGEKCQLSLVCLRKMATWKESQGQEDASEKDQASCASTGSTVGLKKYHISTCTTRSTGGIDIVIRCVCARIGSCSTRRRVCTVISGAKAGDRWTQDTYHEQRHAYGSEEARPSPKSFSGCTESQKNAAQFLVGLHRREHYPMEVIRGRLQQERSRARREGGEIQRESSAGSGKLGQGEGAAVQAGCRVSGRGDDLRWRRRRRRGDHQDGLIRNDSDRNRNYGEQLGDHPHTTARRTSRGGHRGQSKKSKSRLWWCLQSYATFWCARQVDYSETCCWQQESLCFTDHELILNHSAFNKRNFCSPWKASMNAVDLAHEVGTWNLYSSKMFCMWERRLFKGHVRFAERVELFVGHENDLHMQNWPHALEVPHPKAKIFATVESKNLSDESDTVSLLAAHVRTHADFPVHQRDDPALLDNPDIVMDEHQNEDIPHGSESESESLPSEHLQIYAPGRWFTTKVYALNCNPSTLRLDWNDHEGFHHSIATQLGIPPSDLYHVHYIATRPQDLVRANVEAVIAHREGDLQVGSLQRLTLLDVEFHASEPMIDPEVVRKVLQVMDRISRQQLLRLTGIETYCAEAKQRCLLWINDDLIPLHTKVLHIEDGDYIRLALPPGDAPMDHVATDVWQAHSFKVFQSTKFWLGTPCTSWVSMTRWLGHHMSPLNMIMMHMVFFSCLDMQCHNWMTRQCVCDKKPYMNRTHPVRHASKSKMKYNHQNLQEVMMIFHRSRLELWLTCSLLSFMNFVNYGHSMPLKLWKILNRCCALTRGILTIQDMSPAVKVEASDLGEPTSWLRDLVSVWHDQLDNVWPVNIVVVRPVPATATIRQPKVNVIVLQRSLHDMAANHFTIIDSSGVRTEQRCFAGFAPQHLDKRSAIAAADIMPQCEPYESRHRCMIWHGDMEIVDPVHLRNRHGLALLCIINNTPAHTSTSVWEGETEEATGVSFLQLETTRTVLHLDSVIKQTTAVRVISGSIGHLLPSFLEVDSPGSAQQVRDELLRWGHDLAVHDCHFCNTFLCLQHDVDDTELMNYVFLHDDPLDVQGTIFHSTSTPMSITQIMEFLCSMGYSRAVVLDCESLCDDWHRVIFHHREPQGPAQVEKQRVRTAWPERGQHRRTTAQLLDVTHIDDINVKCQMQTAFNKEDLNELFVSNKNLLCIDTSPLQMPEQFQQELQSIPHRQIECPSDLDHYDRLLIFTDGSSRPNMKRLDPMQADELGHPDTWAMAIVGECFNDYAESTLTFFGWAAFPVRYDPEGAAYTGITRIGSDCAERSALIGAGLWRLAMNHAIPTIFCTDAAHVGGQAFGHIGACEIDPSFRLLRSIFQALEAALPQGDLALHHVKAHAGELFNELVDIAAKAEAHKSFNMRRQALHLPTWAPKLRQLWMAFGQQNGVMNVAAPALPAIGDTQTVQPTWKRSSEQLQGVSMASANVQSLYRGPVGHARKLHYLQEQMRFFKFNIMAIQEARSDMSMSQNNGILRLCSGHQNGQGGIEVWIDLQLPFAINNQQKPRFFKRSHFQVVHADHSRMLIRCDAECWSFWLAALHAPHSGHSSADRSAWWRSTCDLLTQHHDGDAFFLLMDANAAPGECDAQVVMRSGFATSANTAEMRALLEALQLYLPATSEIHQGDHATWTNFAGCSTHCIDHIAISQSWYTRCTHSQIVHEFDMATVHEDHRAVAIQLQWTGFGLTRTIKGSQKRFRSDQVFVNDAKYNQQILSCPQQDWQTDVATHTARLTAHLHEVLAEGHSLTRASPKKCYITDEIWTMRARKLAIKKQIKCTGQRLKMTKLASCFSAWKLGHCSPQHGAEHNYDTSLHCSGLRLSAQYYVWCRQLKKSLVLAKQKALDQKLIEVNENTSAAEVLRDLKLFTGPTNPRKCKRKSLPIVKDEEGETVSLPAEALSVWIRFFQRMEGGQRMSMDELRKIWIRELAEFQQEEITCQAECIPSLTDLEVALRRIQKGKARGPDGIPGELCRHHPSALAKLLFPTMMKMILHGHEPLEFKGGRLTMAYKGRGPHDACSSYRSLLVSNHMGKAIHRAIRLQHAEVYEKFLQAQQTGGRRGVPVQLPLHQARAFVRQARAKRHSSAILYLDLTEAFYRILREIPIGGAVTDEFMGYLMSRLNLPSDSLHELHAILAEPPALLQAGMSELNRRCMQAIHASTFFWLEGQEDISRTRIGTRPGDCMADLVFGYAWACVLRKLEAFMQEQEALAFFPLHEHLPLFGHFAAEVSQVSFAGPTWMDDLALCIEAARPETLTRHVAAVGGRLLDLCEQHGMQPNLGRGKTELWCLFAAKHPEKLVFSSMDRRPACNSPLSGRNASAKFSWSAGTGILGVCCITLEIRPLRSDKEQQSLMLPWINTRKSCFATHILIYESALSFFKCLWWQNFCMALTLGWPWMSAQCRNSVLRSWSSIVDFFLTFDMMNTSLIKRSWWKSHSQVH